MQLYLENKTVRPLQIFIDRDPAAFAPILNFLRTKELDLRGVNINVLRHEAEFYGITPLVRRLFLCEELERSSCGSVLFHGYLPPPGIPSRKINSTGRPPAESRHGLSPTEGDARGGGGQPALSGSGEETVRLGKQRKGTSIFLVPADTEGL